MKFCAIPQEDRVSVTWGLLDSPEEFLKKLNEHPHMPRGEAIETGEEIKLHCDNNGEIILTKYPAYGRILRPGDSLERVIELDEFGRVPERPRAQFHVLRGNAAFTESATWQSGWRNNGTIWDLSDLRDLESLTRRSWVSRVDVDAENGGVSVRSDTGEIIAEVTIYNESIGLYRGEDGRCEVDACQILQNRHDGSTSDFYGTPADVKFDEPRESVYGINVADVREAHLFKRIRLRRGKAVSAAQFIKDLFELPETPFTVGLDPEDPDVVTVTVGDETRRLPRRRGADIICRDGETWAYDRYPTYINSFEGHALRVDTNPKKILGRYYAPRTVMDLRRLVEDPRVASVEHERGFTTVTVEKTGKDICFHIRDRGGIVVWNDGKQPTFVKFGDRIGDNLMFAPVEE